MNWHTWLSRFSIQTKLISVVLSLCLIAVALMAGVSQYFYTKAAKDDFFKFAEDTSRRLNHQIDLYLQHMKLSASPLIAGPLAVRSDMIQNPEDVGLIQRWLRQEGTFGPKTRADIGDLLNNYLALNFSEIKNMFLISRDQMVISNGQSYVDPRKYELEVWYNLPLDNKFHVLPTHTSAISGKHVISVLVPILDLDGMEISGRLVIDIAISELKAKTIIYSTMAEKGYFVIVSEDGTIVYHPEDSMLGKPMSQTSLSSISLEQSSSVQILNGTEMLVAYSQSDLTGWKLLAMAPFDEMASGVYIARNSMITVLVIIFIGILIVVPFFARWFTRPIRHLQRLMKRVEKGDLNVRAKVKPGKDEIQLLNVSFNRMSDRLHDLILTVSHMELKEMHIRLRQKEAVIQALQNQINPHLLYNTLEIIKSIAYVEKNHRIEIMAKNLGDYYRYTADISSREVKLREELDQLRKYLEIIKIRFPKKLRTKFYVNEKYLDTYIVKCSIQPIVENAIKFAIEPNYGKGNIIINAYQEQNDLVVEIVDDGPGITEEKLAELKQQLESISRTPHDDYAHSGSLGLANVHARIVLQYGTDYHLQVHSFPGRGTVVSIRVPYRTSN